MPEPISMEECFEAGLIPSNAACRRPLALIARPLPEDDDDEELIDDEFHASSVFDDEDDLDGDDPCEVHNEEDCRLCLLTT